MQNTQRALIRHSRNSCWLLGVSTIHSHFVWISVSKPSICILGVVIENSIASCFSIYPIIHGLKGISILQGSCDYNPRPIYFVPLLGICSGVWDFIAISLLMLMEVTIDAKPIFHLELGDFHRFNKIIWQIPDSHVSNVLLIDVLRVPLWHLETQSGGRLLSG